MKLPGKLPSLDIIMVACRLYGIKVHVYFWPESPVIYQYRQEDENVVHLQCLSGIHFNALVEVKSYIAPDVSQCSVNTVSGLEVNERKGKGNCDMNDSEVEKDECDMQGLNSIWSIKAEVKCDHIGSSLPRVTVSSGEHQICGLIDSGAELSLISESALNKLKSNGKIEVVQKPICEIRGFSGKIFMIKETVKLKLTMGLFSMNEYHDFALVPDEIFPYCLLLGIDFLQKFNTIIDFSRCEIIFGEVPRCFTLSPCTNVNVFNLTSESSHKLLPSMSGGSLRFEIIGSAETVSGLSLLTDDNTIIEIQKRCGELRSLFRMLSGDVPAKQWPEKLRRYKRYKDKLSLIENVIVYGDTNVIVVPFKVCLDLAVALHYNFAHIGRDKLQSLMTNLMWHPKKYQVVSDICTTCATCQLSKDFGTSVVPPTLKISTCFPFELLAIDLMSLPKTSSGFVACLMAVDHYSKFVAAVPLRNKQSQTVIEALSKRLLPFLPAVPVNILSDNGPEFTSDVFSKFLEGCGINHKLTTPYCPTSNGAVERVNRTIQNLLKTIVKEGHRWDEHLARAIISYNNTPHGELGMSPSECLLAKSHKVRGDPPLQPELQSYWRKGHPKFLSFRVGDLVVKRLEHKGHSNVNKFLPKFSGPFKVIKVNSLGITYEIKNCSSGSVLKAHHGKLRIFKEPPNYLSKNELYSKLNRVNLGEDVLNESNDSIMVKDSSAQDDDECSGLSIGGGLLNSSCSENSESSEIQSSVDQNLGNDVLDSSVSGSSACNNSYESDCPLCKFEKELEDKIRRRVYCKCVEMTTAPDNHVEDIVNDYERIRPGKYVEHVYRLTPSLESNSDGEVTYNGCANQSGNDVIHGEICAGTVRVGITERPDGCILPQHSHISIDSVSNWNVSSIDSHENLLEIDDGGNEEEGSFGGFGDDDAHRSKFSMLDRIRSNRNNIISPVSENRIRTRSRGPVNALPHVQPWTIERKRYNTE